MAIVLIPAGLAAYCVVCEYDSDTQVRLYDEPVIAWVVDDATNEPVQPIIPGRLPPPAASPSLYTPQFAHAHSVAATNSPVPNRPGQDVVLIAPNAFRGTLLEFLDWMAAGDGTAMRQLRGLFAEPLCDAIWQRWRNQNSSLTY